MCNESCKSCVVLEQGSCFGLAYVLDCPIFDTAKSLEKSNETDKNERGRE